MELSDLSRSRRIQLSIELGDLSGSKVTVNGNLC